LSVPFAALSSFVGAGYLVNRDTASSFRTSLYAGLIGVFLNLILIRWYGLYGVCFSTVASYMVMFVLRYKWSKREFSFDVNWFLFVFLYFLLVVECFLLIVFNL